MLLKSSDFVTHDLDVHNIFAGCQSDLPNTDEEDARQESDYELELVLRKWYAVDRSREMRCFVRNNFLTGCFVFTLTFGYPNSGFFLSQPSPNEILIIMNS